MKLKGLSKFRSVAIFTPLKKCRIIARSIIVRYSRTLKWGSLVSLPSFMSAHSPCYYFWL
jgi:hypothetical protein